MEDLPAKTEGLARSHGVEEGTLLWRTCEPAPSGMVRPHVARTGRYILVGGGFTGNSDLSRSVFKYDTEKDSWHDMPLAPCNNFGLVVVNQLPTIVGGVNIITGLSSKDSFSFVDIGSKGKWCSLLPPMNVGRSCSSVALTGDFLVVVGGIGELDSSSHEDTVEVLDIREKKWYLASSFPKPVAFMSIAASDSSIYLTGGLTPNGATREVFHCSVNELVQKAKSLDRSGSVWKVLSQMPYYRSGCAIIQETLVVFGGLKDHEVQNGIFAWDGTGQTWKKLGRMPMKRTSLSIGVTGSSKALLIGGYNDPKHWSMSLISDIVEVVNLVA